MEGYNAVRTIGPDKFFNFKVLSQNPKIIYARKPLFEYRVHFSPNAAAQKSNVKQQIDDYLYTLEYSEQVLNKYGIQKKEMIDVFLDRICLKNGLTQMAYGTYKQAVKMWAFTLASYPEFAIRNIKFFLLLFLIILGPLGRLIAMLAYKLYKSGN